jgi:hypothetical protein
VALSALVCASAVAAIVSLAGQEGRTPEAQGSIHATTAMEIAHAKLQNRSFETLGKLADTRTIYYSPSQPAPGEGPKYEDFIQEQVCNADLVILGEVIASHSMLNQMETFIFTDYLVKIEIPIRITRPLDSRPVVVTQAGGQIILNGKKVSASVSPAASIYKGGRYIFLLESLSADNDYQPWPRLGVIEDQGGQATVSPRNRWSPEIFFTNRLKFADIQRDITDTARRCK